MTDIETYYRSNRDKLFGYLLRMSACTDVAADLMQETFVRYMDRYGTQTVQPPLLYRIARNLFIDAIRKNGKLVPLPERLTDPTPDPEQALSDQAEFNHVLHAMKGLKEDERELLSLVSGDSGLTYEQIGSIVGISEANVKVKIHRARIKLRELLRR
jgi:RNA polymerase sigma-70 factor (ECF subfamily)